MATISRYIHGSSTYQEKDKPNYADIPPIKVTFDVTPTRTSHSSETLNLEFSNVKVAMDKVASHNYTYGYYIRAFVSNNTTSMSSSSIQSVMSTKHVNEWQNGTMRLATITESEAEAGGVEWEIPYSFPSDEDGIFEFGSVTDNSASITVYLKTQAGCPECSAGPGYADHNVGSMIRTNSFTIAAADIPDYWTNISGGSITVSDNKNKVKITGTNFKNGDNNDVASSNLQITFKDSSGRSLNTSTAKTPYVVSVGTTSEGEINKSINIANVVASSDLANVAKVDVKLVGTGDQGDTRTKTATTNPINIKYYTCPAAPSSLWYESNGKSSLNGTFNPSYKKDLTWKWSGAAGGTNAPVVGYRAFFVNETKSVYIDTDIANITATSKVKTESEIGKNPCYETTGTTMKFNPQTVGFDKNEICTCYVYAYSTWGNGDKLFSNSDGAPRYPGDRAVKSAQCTFSSGAVVWIKIPKPDDPDTLEWKEGTVYVHNGSGWKEAEGVYVHNGTGWKEST
jgi:hypothetical protein